MMNKFNNFKRTAERPLIWAHRGASGYAPENTIISFQKAIDLKADGIELDIQLTKDGEIVVIHDEWLERVSDGKGWVKDYTLEELRRFNFNRTMPEYEHAVIPTLREVYELIKPSGLTINVELKTGIIDYPYIAEKTAALTKELQMEGQVLYSSFNHATCVRMHELLPDSYVGFLYADSPIGMSDYAQKYGADALHPALYHLLKAGYVQDAAEHGLDINSWTINEPEHLAMACKLGINAIITNYPDRALKIAENMKLD